MCESHPYYWAKDLLEDFGNVELHSDNTISFKCEDESFRTFLEKLMVTIYSLRGNTNLYETDELLAQFIELYSYNFDLTDHKCSLSVHLLIRMHLIRGLRFRTSLVSYMPLRNEEELTAAHQQLKNAIEVIIDIYSSLT